MSYSVLSVCVLLVREEDVLALLVITEFFKTCSGLELVLRYEPGTYHCAIESRVRDINVNDVVKLLYSLERETHKIVYCFKQLKEMFYLTSNTTRFTYGYMTSDKS